MEKKFIMEYGTNINFVSFSNYLEAQVPDVGLVIARHTGIAALSEGGYNAQVLWTYQVRPAFINYMLQHGIERREESVYVSPFVRPAYSDEFGTVVVPVTKELILEWIARAEACTGTEEELVQIGRDSDYAARYFSELSIDAAKKLVVVDCEYIHDLGSPLLSRRGSDDAFGIKINWESKKGEVKFAAPPRKLKPGKASVSDWLNEIRLEELSDISEMVGRLAEKEQTIPKEVVSVVEDVISGADKQVKAVFNMVRRAYLSISAARKREDKKIRDELSGMMSLDDETAKQFIKDAIQTAGVRYKKLYRTLTDVLRHASEGMNWERAALLFGLSCKDAEYTSSILHSLLPEEYLLWVLEMGKMMDAGYKDYVQVNIINKGYAEGDVAEFEYGAAQDGDKAAFANSDISGSWLVCKDEETGRLVARKSLKEYVKIPKAQDVAIVATKAVETGAATFVGVNKGAHVSLPQGKGDYMLVVDGKAVAKADTFDSNIYHGKHPEGYVIDRVISEERSFSGGVFNPNRKEVKRHYCFVLYACPKVYTVNKSAKLFK
mgnify:CR=1 FL=1